MFFALKPAADRLYLRECNRLYTRDPASSNSDTLRSASMPRPRRRRTRSDSASLLRRAAFEALELRQMLANSIWAYPGIDGHVLYKPRTLGDHIEDYANVGYMGGTVPLPDVPTKVTISPVAGD